MVGIVEGWFQKENNETKRQFLETPKEELISYHTTLGRKIRNEFKLWDIEWKPEIKNGVDYSPNHPDQVSMKVIETVWEKLKNS